MTHSATDPPVPKLTPRQRDVLELVARGLTNQEIGNTLQISVSTVHAHLSTAFTTLQVTNRTEATTAFLDWQARSERDLPVLDRPAIAVLAVLALDDNRKTVTIAAGITRDLVALFSRWSWFPVINASSMIHARGATAKELGERLGARFLVDASLGRSRASWRINVQVTDTRTGHCIWADVRDFTARALFEAQDFVIESIVARTYRYLITVALANAKPTSRPEQLSTWELAHAAFDLQSRRDRESTARARECFGAALAREPTLVLAHFGLGLTAYDEILNQWSSAPEAIERLGASARRCIELAPHMAEGYFLAGRLCQVQGNQSGALQPLETAVELNPSFAPGHALLAQVQLINGHLQEGLARMKLANRLGPDAYVAGLALAYFARHEWALALEAAEQAVATRAHYPFGRALAAASAYWSGDTQRAQVHARALYQAQPNFRVDRFRDTFGAKVDAVARMTTALQALGHGRTS